MEDRMLNIMLYNHVKKNNIPVAYLKNAVQTVISKQTRNKSKLIDSITLFQEKYGYCPNGPMYRWFPEIRDKSKWMTIIDE